MSEHQILVVEDDPSVRTLLVRALRSKGYAVDEAEDGLAALVKLGEMEPDLLIVDIMMPRLDGMGFVRAIKAHSKTKAIPVIFLTAKDDPKTMINSINIGAKFYLTKPFNLDELNTKIQKALES